MDIKWAQFCTFTKEVSLLWIFAVDRWAFPRENSQPVRSEEFVSRYDAMTKPSKDYPVFDGKLPGNLKILAWRQFNALEMSWPNRPRHLQSMKLPLNFNLLPEFWNPFLLFSPQARKTHINRRWSSQWVSNITKLRSKSSLRTGVTLWGRRWPQRGMARKRCTTVWVLPV